MLVNFKYTVSKATFIKIDIVKHMQKIISIKNYIVILIKNNPPPMAIVGFIFRFVTLELYLLYLKFYRLNIICILNGNVHFKAN